MNKIIKTLLCNYPRCHYPPFSQCCGWYQAFKTCDFGKKDEEISKRTGKLTLICFDKDDCDCLMKQKLKQKSSDNNFDNENNSK